MTASPLVIAHRGVHGPGLTENTIAAFEAAVSAGADMIELDVRRTAGDELVVIHDYEHHGVAIDSVSLDELERRTGFRPPTLAQTLDWAHGRIALDVELKEDGYVGQVLDLLAEFQNGDNRLLVTSFIDEVLQQISERAPQVPRGLLLGWTAEQALDRARICGASTLLPQMKIADEPLFAQAGDAGLELITWDFMPDSHAELLTDNRVAAVITDDVSGTIAARETLIGRKNYRSSPDRS